MCCSFSGINDNHRNPKRFLKHHGEYVFKSPASEEEYVPHYIHVSNLSRPKYFDKNSKILHPLCLTVSLELIKNWRYRQIRPAFIPLIEFKAHFWPRNKTFMHDQSCGSVVCAYFCFNSFFLWRLFPLFFAGFFCLLTFCFVIVLPFIWKTFNAINFEAQPTSWAYKLVMMKYCVCFNNGRDVLNGLYATLAVKYLILFSIFYKLFSLPFSLRCINLLRFIFIFIFRCYVTMPNLLHLGDFLINIQIRNSKQN